MQQKPSCGGGGGGGTGKLVLILVPYYGCFTGKGSKIDQMGRALAQDNVKCHIQHEEIRLR